LENITCDRADDVDKLYVVRALCVQLCMCVVAGDASDTEYESYDDDDDRRPDTDRWQPASDHDEIRLPQ